MRRSTIASVLLLTIVGVSLVDVTGTAGTAGPASVDSRGPRAAAVERVKKDSVPPEVAKVQAYVDLTAKSLDRRVQNAIAKIDGTPRKLLALKSYLGRGNIDGQWAWTDREMAAYRRSIDFRRANAEVDKVISLFQRSYRGYQLRTVRVARSIEDQIDLWNKTTSVGALGTALSKQILVAMDSPAYPDTATRQSLRKFQALLRKQGLRGVPTVSVPGLSEHGQLRAYDFIIWQGDKILAGSDGASIRNQWIGGGWGNRLRQIVYTASSRFDGPLQSPNEPWHYTYIR